jgi:hypothetical protein
LEEKGSHGQQQIAIAQRMHEQVLPLVEGVRRT